MRLGQLVYDVEAIAKHYSMDVTATCWPVLLSTKPGNARLCLCGQWGTTGHTSLDSSAHQRPKKFNLVHIVKAFTAKASNNTGAGAKRKAVA